MVIECWGRKILVINYWLLTVAGSGAGSALFDAVLAGVEAETAGPDDRGGEDEGQGRFAARASVEHVVRQRRM